MTDDCSAHDEYRETAGKTRSQQRGENEEMMKINHMQLNESAAWIGKSISWLLMVIVLTHDCDASSFLQFIFHITYGTLSAVYS